MAATLGDVEKARLAYEKVKNEARESLLEEIKVAEKKVQELKKKFTSLYGKRRGPKPGTKRLAVVKKAPAKKAAPKKAK